MSTSLRKRLPVFRVQRLYLLFGVLLCFMSVTLVANATLTVSSSGLSGDSDVTVDAAGKLNIGSTSATGITIGKTGLQVTIPGSLAVTGNTNLSGTLGVAGASALATTTITNLTVTTCTGCSSGSGISSLNGLSGPSQTFATSASGSIFNVTSSGAVHTFTFPATPSFTSLTLGSPLTVANGGIGQSSLTANALLLGNGTNGIATLSPGTIYQVLQSKGSGAPSFADIGSLITAGTNLTSSGTSTLAVVNSPTFSGTLTVAGTSTLATTTVTNLTVTGTCTGCGAGGGSGTVSQSTSTYVAVYSASTALGGYSAFAYNPATQTLSAPTTTLSGDITQSGGGASFASTTISGNATTTGNLVVLGSIYDVSGNKYSTSTASLSAVPVILSTFGPVNASGTEGFYYNNSGGALAYNLPAITTALVGAQYCFRDYTGQTGAITLQAPGSTYIDVMGTNSSAGGTLVSTGALGDSACVVAASTTEYEAYLNAGSWTNN